MSSPASAEPTPLLERLRAVCGQLNVLHAQLVAMTAEAVASGEWVGDGVRSLEHWLTWQAGISSSHAKQVAHLAAASTTHPQVTAQFAAGALSMDQAAIATHTPAYLDGWFAEVAPSATVSQLRLMARAARDPEPAPAAADERPERAPEVAEALTFWFDESGRFHMRGELDDDHGRIVERALTEARDALFHAGHHDASWPEALVELAERSLGTTAAPRRERFRANWFIDPTDQVPARWIDGIPVPRWLFEHLTCDGRVAPTFVASGRPIAVAPTVATIPDRTRRTILHRDHHHCRVPGCSQTRWLEVHHLVHREHGGGHDTANLASLCPYHHRLHHQGRLGITGDADQPNGLVLTDAQGAVIDWAAHPTKRTGPPPEPAVPYAHPLGERLQRWAILFPDPPPAAPPAAPPSPPPAPPPAPGPAHPDRAA